MYDCVYSVKVINIKIVMTITIIIMCKNLYKQGKEARWNQQVQTDRTIPNNKPDIIIRDNENETCMLIEVAI
jgi:hypothetical protein